MSNKRKKSYLTSYLFAVFFLLFIVAPGLTFNGDIPLPYNYVLGIPFYMLGFALLNGMVVASLIRGGLSDNVPSKT
jgi:ABC-type amino acid transport system permease subunit